MTDPRTGNKKEIAKLLEAVTIQQAAQHRADLVEAARKPVVEVQKMRVGDYAKSWIESKALRLDASTVKTYTDALEDHILPALGDYYYDQLMSTDVQKWLDTEMLRGWTTEVKGRKDKKKKERRLYSRNSIGVWFRVFTVHGLRYTFTDLVPVGRLHRRFPWREQPVAYALVIALTMIMLDVLRHRSP